MKLCLSTRAEWFGVWQLSSTSAAARPVRFALKLSS
jgi:hypothetical protein